MVRPTPSRRLGVSLLLLAGATLSSAAYADSTAETVFRFSPGQILIPLFVAIVAGVVAFLSQKQSWGARVTFPAGLIAIVALLIVTPNMAVDRVTVTPEKIEQHTGFWFAPTVKGFNYSEVQSVRIGTGLGTRRPKVLWYVRQTNGKTMQLDPGDLWEFNTAEIVPLLEKYGVTFE